MDQSNQMKVLLMGQCCVGRCSDAEPLVSNTGTV